MWLCVSEAVQLQCCFPLEPKPVPRLTVHMADDRWHFFEGLNDSVKIIVYYLILAGCTFFSFENQNLFQEYFAAWFLWIPIRPSVRPPKLVLSPPALPPPPCSSLLLSCCFLSLPSPSWHSGKESTKGHSQSFVEHTVFWRAYRVFFLEHTQYSGGRTQPSVRYTQSYVEDTHDPHSLQ